LAHFLTTPGLQEGVGWNSPILPVIDAWANGEHGVVHMNVHALASALAVARARRRLPPPDRRRQIRERAGLTPEQLAQIVGVAGPTIRRWERGLREPRAAHVERYLAALTRLTEARQA
jgi:DNA-binding transcriptional regulator YiaG